MVSLVAILLLMAIALAGVATLAACARAPRVGAQLSAAVHRLHPPPAAPQGRPVERLAADLRRVRRSLDDEPHLRHAKLQGILAAYDDLLVEAGRALDVETSLGALPPGLAREAERLRVEYRLELAGLLPPRRDSA